MTAPASLAPTGVQTDRPPADRRGSGGAGSDQPRPLLRPGDIVDGRYRIIEQLADGGMGTVFLAEHVLIKRRFAIKVLHRELASDTSMVERFMNEALAAGTLGHPHIVESTDMGFTASDVPYIVFEYLEGSLLTEEIYRTGGMSVRRAVGIARQIASALEVAHNAGIFHLDLKADNVYLTDKDDTQDHVKVLDFGISRFIKTETTQRGLVMGTPEYMAPEQVTCPDMVDKRADVYALGVMLYEMLTARRPFSGDDPRVLLYRIVNEAVPPIDQPNVPPELEHLIVENMLAKAPAQRFAAMRDVEDALDGVMGWLGLTAAGGALTIATPEVIPDEALPEEPARPLSLTWLAALAVVAIIAGAALTIAGSRGAADSQVAAIAGFEADAEHLAATVDAQARTTRARADGVAMAPMLRAAIETDAATIRDLASSEALFAVRPGETVEVFLVRDQQLTSVLRVPSTAPPLTASITATTRLASSRTGLRIVASAPVLAQGGGLGGVLAISMPTDLTSLERRVVSHASGATLLGFDRPLVLAAPTEPSVGTPIAIPVQFDPGLVTTPVSLTGVLPVVTRGHGLRTGGQACAAAGGLALAGFAVAQLRRRRAGPRPPR